jgi:hypothetical protein
MNLIEARCLICHRIHARQIDFERLGTAAALEAFALVIAAALAEGDRLDVTQDYLPRIHFIGGYYPGQLFDHLFHPVRHPHAAQPIQPLVAEIERQLALAIKLTWQDAQALAAEALEQRGRRRLTFARGSAQRQAVAVR